MTPSESGKLGAIAWKKTAMIRRQEKIDIYNLCPKECKGCLNTIEFDKRKNQYCSQSCSGIFTGLRKNLRQVPEVWNCLFCGKEHPTQKYEPGQYCDNKCHQDHLYKIRIEKWKETGETDNKGTPGWLKRYILEKQGSKCASDGCNVTTVWNGKPIIFDLEHKDGNSKNDVEENLCCLCPNCHSQTSTYKNRNKGNGRHFRRERYKEGKSF